MEINPQLIIPALVIPLTELFPEWYASYFLPPQMDDIDLGDLKEEYESRIMLRTFIFYAVLIPIAYTLIQIDWRALIPIGFIIYGFISKEYEISKMSFVYYTIGFLMIFGFIDGRSSGVKKNKTKLLILIGTASFCMSYGLLNISQFRHSDMVILDIVGRIMFSIGFVSFIQAISVVNNKYNVWIIAISIIFIILCVISHFILEFDDDDEPIEIDTL